MVAAWLGMQLAFLRSLRGIDAESSAARDKLYINRGFFRDYRHITAGYRLSKSTFCPASQPGNDSPAQQGKEENPKGGI